eukprot:scaffold84342_cov23-Phaeocystis_antarctica.AAC.1
MPGTPCQHACATLCLVENKRGSTCKVVPPTASGRDTELYPSVRPCQVLCVTAGALGTDKGCPWHASDSLAALLG